MLSPLLVGLDFSASCAFALEHARYLGATMRRPVQLLHVVENPWWQTDAGIAQWLHVHKVAMGEIVTRTGPPWAEIARYADELDAELVVVGSHGKSGYQPLVPGSTTARLLTRTSVPVLVVRGRPPFKNGGRR